MYKSLTFTTDVHHAAGGTLFIEVFFLCFWNKMWCEIRQRGVSTSVRDVLLTETQVSTLLT